MGFLKPSEWGAAAAVAGITYGAMLVASVLLGLILILLFNAALEEAGNSAFGMDELVTFLRERGGAYLAVAFIVQLTAMGLGGRFHLRLSGDQPGQLLTASIHHVPLLVTVVGVLALYWSSRVLARRRASRGDHPGAVAVWLSSLVSAVMLTVGAVLISLILAGRASETDGYTTLTMRFSAVSPGLSLIPLVVGTLVGVWGRRAGAGSAPTPVSDRVHRWVPGLAPAARLTGLYLGAMAVLCLVAFSLQSAISEGSVVVFFGGLLFGGFGAVDLLGLLHLSGVSLSMASVGERISETGYLWSGDLSGWGVRWLMLLWIPMLLGLCALAFAWAGRRPVLNRGTSWIAMPTVFLLAGILVLWAGRLGAEASAIGYFDVHARVGASWWTPLVFLIWGGIVEAAARYLVPRVAGSVPQGRFRRLLLGAPVPVAFTAGAAAASGADAARSGDEAAGPGGVPGDGAAPSGDAATPTAAPAAAGGGGAEPIVGQETLPLPVGSSPEAAAARPAGPAEESAAGSTPGVAPGAAPGTTPGADPAAGGLPEAAPLSPAAKKRLKISGIIAGALVLVLILAFAGVRIANATVYSPEHVVEEDPDALSLTVLPGEYTFAAPKGGKYLTYGDDQKVTVTADEDTSSALSGSTVEFRQRLTEQAVTDAAAKAKEKIDACVAKKEFKVAECGLNSYYEADDRHRNPSWSVEEYPTFMLTDGLNSTDTDPVGELETGQQLYVRTSESGKVKFSYQYRFDDDEPWEDKSTTSPLSGAFMITVTPEEITVQDSHSSNGY